LPVFDFVCFGLDAQGKLSDDRFMVFFNQKAAPDDAITLQKLAEQSATFAFDLDKVPAPIERLVFTLSVDGAGAMRDLGASELTLSAGGNAFVRYRFSGADFDTEGALMLAEVYRKDGEWRFWAQGQGFAGDLNALLQHFGGEVAAEPSAFGQSAPAPLPSPQTPPSAPVSDPASASAPLEGAPLPNVIPAQMGELQKTLDGAPVGATIRLPRGEYRGPIALNHALTIEGEGAVIWARSGPVVRVQSEGVVLRGVQIEVTDAEAGAPESDVALWVARGTPVLQRVGVRGRVVGLSRETAGEWKLPVALNLGAFAPRALNSWTFSVEVPLECRLKTSVSGLQIKPAQLGAGKHEVTIVAGNIGPDTFLAGQIEVEHGGIVRPIPLSGRAEASAMAAQNKRIG